MTTTKAETNLGVISPTGHVVVEVGDYFGGQAGVKQNTITLEADDYDGIADFYVAARQKMLDEHNHRAVKLHVFSINAGFDTTDFLDKGHLTDELWVMMQLESHEIEMLYAYQDATGVNVATDVTKALNAAQQRQLA